MMVHPDNKAAVTPQMGANERLIDALFTPLISQIEKLPLLNSAKNARDNLLVARMWLYMALQEEQIIAAQQAMARQQSASVEPTPPAQEETDAATTEPTESASTEDSMEPAVI